jgi:hypothetical protein
MDTGNAIEQLLRVAGFDGLYAVASAAAGVAPRFDLSIEGMRSQQFSVGVFFFMLLGVVVFGGIIYAVAFGRFAPKTMRRGEKVLFGGIIAGTILAVAFGAAQLITGYLF